MRGILPSAILIHLCLCAAAFAASTSLGASQDQKKFLEEERRREMDARPKPDEDMKQPFLWDAGGWLHTELDYLNDQPDRRSRTLRYVDLRLWAEAKLDRTYAAYVRLQTEYTDFNPGDQFAGRHDNIFRSPHIDQAFLEADWRESEQGLMLRAGRQFVSLGSGLLFNDVAYALQGSYGWESFGLRGWVAHSIIHHDDLDRSLPNARDSRRGFLGLEADYLLTGDHRLYALFLVERDFNREKPANAAQDWDYNANYVGLGGRGTVWGALGYSAEAVYEFGQTVGAGSTKADPISAFAFIATVDYQFGGEMQPAALFQYIFGSGDSDRGSVTDVASGNLSGTNDTSFLSFGFIQTGFSLFPRVSNIHILRLGGSIRPLVSTELFHSVDVGIYGYYYRKAVSQEPISDPRSFLNNVDVGKEIDLLLRWRIFSDLGFSLNYGLFFPGAAYSEKGARNFVNAGITYSF